MTTIPGTVLQREAILEMVQGSPPLVSEFLDLGSQVQPQGFDLTVREVHAFSGPGQLGSSNSQRTLPETWPLPFDDNGFVTLPPGAYLTQLNEVMSLPKDLMALGRPRSTLLRCGVDVGTAVWDAGYHGRSQCLLHVHNPAGFRLAKDARILQLVFFRLQAPAGMGYNGIYQKEHLKA